MSIHFLTRTQLTRSPTQVCMRVERLPKRIAHAQTGIQTECLLTPELSPFPQIIASRIYGRRARQRLRVTIPRN